MNKKNLTDKFRPPATRICTGCKKDKALAEYYLNTESRDGRHSKCGDCLRAIENQKKNNRKEKAKTFFDAKYFTLFFLLLSTTAFSQVPDTTAPLREYNWSARPTSEPFYIPPYCNTAGVTLITYPPDTIRAKLLVTYTTRRWGVAHARDGYVVTKDGEVIAFFTDKMECFPPETELWKWREANKKIIKTRHARN